MRNKNSKPKIQSQNDKNRKAFLRKLKKPTLKKVERFLRSLSKDEQEFMEDFFYSDSVVTEDGQAFEPMVCLGFMLNKVESIHLGCPSFPVCDDYPSGCLHAPEFNGDTEVPGHRG